MLDLLLMINFISYARLKICGTFSGQTVIYHNLVVWELFFFFMWPTFSTQHNWIDLWFIGQAILHWTGKIHLTFRTLIYKPNIFSWTYVTEHLEGTSNWTWWGASYNNCFIIIWGSFLIICDQTQFLKNCDYVVDRLYILPGQERCCFRASGLWFGLLCQQ